MRLYPSKLAARRNMQKGGKIEASIV